MENHTDSDNKNKILTLYHEILKQWNQRNAAGMANLFEDDGDLIGFNGSRFYGKGEIEKHLSYIFANYPTPKYVGKMRSIRFLNPKVGVLIGVGGLVEPDRHDIRQELNAVQTLVALKQGKEGWKISFYQNTPAAYHGRPELGEQLTEELRQVLYQHGPAS
jgi:uncharacterized protein (TIGR02246 family)